VITAPPVRPTAGRRWALAAALAAAGLTIALAPIPVVGRPPAERHVRLEARSYAFTPPIVHVQPGDRVVLEVVSTDVVHGIYVEGYDLSITADPGQTARLDFVADRAGSFRIRCSVTCGPLHPFMIGKLAVGTNLLFMRAAGLLALAALAGFLWVLR
jgi:heme/copper-type cytochrome/quinol oxidase subunit 2